MVLTLLLSATLGLSACGAAHQAGAAAIVDGKVISDQDVQRVSGELSSISPDGQKLTSSEALFLLILTPYVLAETKPAVKTAAEGEAHKVVTRLSKPSPSTTRVVQMQFALQQLDNAGKASVVRQIGKARITVNPRYGTFDATRVALNPNTPDWIKPSATTPAK